ncbi:MAG: EamA family transporter [Bacteroidota bacterium]
MKKQAYYLAAISAFIIWGFIPLPLRALSEYSSLQILFFRLVIALFLLLLINFVFRKEALRSSLDLFQRSTRAEKQKALFYCSLGGALLAVNWLAYIYVLNHISIQTASYSYLICPIMTAILGFLILKEPLKVNQWVAIGLSILSCYLIGVESWINLCYSLLVGSTYAFYLITQRLMKQYDKMVLLNWQLLVSFILIGPLYFYLEGGFPPKEDFYAYIVVLSVVFTIVPLFLNLYALNELKSGTIGILMYINPLINFAVAFLYYQEEAALHQVISYVLIGISLVIYNFNFQVFRQKQLS